MTELRETLSPPKASVLLVDDEPANLLALEALLDGMDLNLAAARSGPEALERLAENEFAVVLLDVQMHGMDGFETARHIRSQERSRHTPVIFLTGYDADRPTVEKAYALGAVDFLVKPLMPVVLRAKVEGFVELFEKTQQIRQQAERLRDLERSGYERQIAEQGARLRDQREWLRTTLASIGDGVIATDARGGVVFLNPVAQSLTGWTEEEAEGQPLEKVFQIIDEATRRPAENPLAKVFAKQIVASLGNRTVLIARNGAERPVEDSAAPIIDDRGNVLGVALIFHDVTEQRRADRELREAEEAVRSLLRISARLNSTLDVETLLDILVEESLRLVGAESGVSGLRMPEGMVCHRYFQQGRALPLEYCWPPLRGLPGWLLVHKVPYLTNDARSDTQIDHELCARFGVHSALCTPILNASNEVLGFFEIHNKKGGGFTPADQEKLVAVSQAASIAIQNALAYRQVRQAEAALRDADRRKDEFLAMLSHELRNPLAPVRNALQILKMPRADAAAQAQARGMIERQVQHLVRLVDDLLDVSRIMRDKIELRKERIDLATVIERAVEIAQPTVDAYGHELSVVLPPEPVWLEGDMIRLAQAVSNLLTNAAKYTERAGRIALTAGRKDDEVVIRVKDSGVGIDRELLPRIFDLFVQADRSLARSQGGLGIGLTLVKRVVELHGGSVVASSAGAGQGSEFTIRLPAPTVHPPATVDQTPVAPGPRRRVLVVDDNVDAAESVAMLLRMWEHDVRTAYDGRSAIQAVQEERPDVVLLDIGLPGMSGYEVAQHLRAQPSFRDLTVIAMTGYGQDEDRRRSRAAGFDLHLTKPLDPETLARAVASPKQLTGKTNG